MSKHIIARSIARRPAGNGEGAALQADAGTSAALAKLTLPWCVGAVPRERLFGLLDQGRARPLVWISGPPGAGKTTLAATYLESRSLAALWYHVDSGDADPATFFEYLGLAVGGDQTLPAPPESGDLTAFTRLFFRALFARVPRPAVLVLDDHHEVPGGAAAFHALLVHALSEIPDGVNVVITSRGEPPSQYARLLANRSAARLDWADLRLTTAEARAIARAAHPLDDAAVDVLFRQSDGWVAGLALMLECIGRSGAAARDVEAEGRQALFEYFASEVMHGMSRDDARILLATAHLPRVTAAAAQTVSGSDRAGSVLDGLRSRHLFTVRHAGSPPRYEHLAPFREFLLARAEETCSRKERLVLTRRAARILADDGDIEAAVALHERVQDWQAAIDSILAHAPHLRGRALRDLVDALPADRIHARPRLLYWYGASLIEVDPPAARRTLQAAFERLQMQGDPAGQMLAVSGLIAATLCEGVALDRLDPWIEVLDRLLGSDPAFPSPDAELRIRTGLLAALGQRRPDDPRLPALARTVTELLDTELDANARIAAATALVAWHTGTLDCDGAKPIVALTEALLAGPEVTAGNRASWLVEFGRWLALELKPREALAALDEACDLAQAARLGFLEGPLRLARHLAHLAAGDGAASDEDIEALRDVAHPGRPLIMSALHRMLADRARLQRRTVLAVTHSETAVAFADAGGAQPERALCRLLLAATLLVDRRYEEAQASLDAARDLCAWSRPFSREFGLLEACIALRCGARERCRAALQNALAAARAERWPSVLLIAHPALMGELCAEALRAGIRAEQAGRLVRQYRLPSPAPDLEAWPWPIRIYALGGFRVVKHGAEIRFERKAQRRPLELLQALIAFGGAGVAVSALATALWPDAEGDAAYHAFENALYRLRQLLGAADALVLAGGKLSLDPRHCWVDVRAFEHRLDAAGEAASPDVLEAALPLYRGHFLGQEGERRWALPMRERLREKMLRHVRRAAQVYERAGAWSEAAEVYQRGLELEDLAEDLYRGLMVCHRELGNHAEPVRIYRRCRELLSIVLGVQPAARTQAVYRSLRES